MKPAPTGESAMPLESLFAALHRAPFATKIAARRDGDHWALGTGRHGDSDDVRRLLHGVQRPRRSGGQGVQVQGVRRDCSRSACGRAIRAASHDRRCASGASEARDFKAAIEEEKVVRGVGGTVDRDWRRGGRCGARRRWRRRLPAVAARRERCRTGRRCHRSERRGDAGSCAGRFESGSAGVNG